MTTQRQVNRLVKPLLERHPDLEQVGRWIFLKPVHHVLRAVLVERISEAARFRPWWAVCETCYLWDSFPLNWATMIRRDGLWEWNIPTIGEEFIAAVEEQALPQLRAIETLDDFVRLSAPDNPLSLTYFDHYLLQTVGVDAARGKRDAALAACSELATGRTKWSMPIFAEEFRRITRDFCPLLAADDRPAMGAMLRQFEAHTVSKLKIAHIYEPTPFPFETA